MCTQKPSLERFVDIDAYRGHSWFDVHQQKIPASLTADGDFFAAG